MKFGDFIYRFFLYATRLAIATLAVFVVSRVVASYGYPLDTFVMGALWSYLAFGETK